MTFWDWLYRVGPGWPNERGWVTLGIFTLAGSMLKMAEVHPGLWDIELFKVLIQAVIISAVINMITAFWFAANKTDETKSENTGKMADAMKAVAESTSTPQPVQVVNEPSDPVPITDLPQPEFQTYPEEGTKP